MKNTEHMYWSARNSGCVAVCFGIQALTFRNVLLDVSSRWKTGILSLFCVMWECWVSQWTPFLSQRERNCSAVHLYGVSSCVTLTESNQLRLSFFLSELKRAVPPTFWRPCPQCRYQFALCLCTEDKQVLQRHFVNTLISYVETEYKCIRYPMYSRLARQ
jgi:hypothetical protein